MQVARGHAREHLSNKCSSHFQKQPQSDPLPRPPKNHNAKHHINQSQVVVCIRHSLPQLHSLLERQRHQTSLRSKADGSVLCSERPKVGKAKSANIEYPAQDDTGRNRCRQPLRRDKPACVDGTTLEQMQVARGHAREHLSNKCSPHFQKQPQSDPLPRPPKNHNPKHHINQSQVVVCIWHPIPQLHSLLERQKHRSPPFLHSSDYFQCILIFRQQLHEERWDFQFPPWSHPHQTQEILASTLRVESLQIHCQIHQEHRH